MNEASDSHEIPLGDLLKRADVCRATLWRHIKLGHIEQGARRKGVHGTFWTRGQANKYLRKIGRRDHVFE